jgi:DNA-binding MarR family transcriptional regulator
MLENQTIRKSNKMMIMTDKKALTNELLDFFNRFHSWETSVVQESACTVSESHAIEALGIYGDMNMRTLATRLGVTTGTITVTVDRLEKKGLAKREKTIEDRRVYIIKLTSEGEKEYKKHYKHHMALTEEIIDLLSAEEAKVLIEILNKINSQIL